MKRLQRRRLTSGEEPRFIPMRSRYRGHCGICHKSYSKGDRIYWYRGTKKTRTMCVHQFCYLQRTGAFAASFKPSPRESVLEQMRQIDALRAAHRRWIARTKEGRQHTHAEHEQQA